MSSKVATAFLLILLFCFSLSCAARPAPYHDTSSTPIETHPESVHEIEVQPMDMEERCEADDEECFMRRTLAAHLDYIYTQKHKP